MIVSSIMPYCHHIFRHRFCSSITPPFSDESQPGGDDWTPMSMSDSNLVIDESSNLSSETVDKASPTSSSNSGNILFDFITLISL